MSQKQSRKLRKLAITRREYKRIKKAHKPHTVHLNHEGYAKKAYIAWLNRRYFEITRTKRFKIKTRRQQSRERVKEFYAN